MKLHKTNRQNKWTRSIISVSLAVLLLLSPVLINAYADSNTGTSSDEAALGYSGDIEAGTLPTTNDNTNEDINASDHQEDKTELAQFGDPGAVTALGTSISVQDGADEASGDNMEDDNVDDNEADTAIHYTVKFYVDGSVYDVLLVRENEMFQLPADPESPDGMGRFIGWFMEGTWEPFSHGSAVTADLSLTARFESEEVQTLDAPIVPFDSGDTYAVTFQVAGEADYVIDVLKNTLIPFPEDPTPQPGDPPFLGWYQQGETTPFNKLQVVTEDITLEAKFSDNHLVTFYDTTGLVLEILELEPLDTVPVTTASPTLGAGEFVEYWHLEGDGTTPFTFGQTTSSSIALYPKINTHSIAIFVTRGPAVEPQFGADGFTATDPLVLDPSLDMSREGYTFVRWSATENGTTAFNFSTPITGTVLIYAVWTPKTVQYAVNFWNEVENFNGDPGDPTIAANRANYELVYTHMVSPGVTAGSVITINQATANSLYTNGGTAVSYILHYSTYAHSETKAISGAGTTVINVYYKRTEFTFNFNLTQATNNATVGGGYVKLRDGSQITASPYTIVTKLGQDISEIWPVETGRTDGSTLKFINWSSYYGNGGVLMVATSINQAVNGGYSTYKRPTSFSTELKGQWGTANFTEQRYYYVENLEGDTSGVPFTAKASYEGTKVRYYTFNYTGALTNQTSNPATYANGWPGGVINGFEQITAASPKLTTYFQEVISEGGNHYRIEYYMRRLSYNLTLITNGGTFASPDGFSAVSGGYQKSLQYEESIVLPAADPVKTNYVFMGWYTDENFANPYVPGGTMPYRNMTLYARFDGTDCTVNYYDGTTLLRANTYATGDMISSHMLAGTGYESYQVGDSVPGKGIFQGWYYQVGSSGNVMIEFPLDIRLYNSVYNLYAKWNSVLYTITYKGVEDSITVTYGSEQVRSGDRNTLAMSGSYGLRPTRDKYDFVEWNTQPDGTGTRFTEATRVVADIEVYAVWRLKPFQLIYVPPVLDYGTQNVSVYNETYQRVPATASDQYISLLDARGPTASWRLTASATPLEPDTPLLPDIDGAIKYVAGGSTYYLNSGDVVLHSGTGQTTSTPLNIVWGANEGILLEVPGNTALSGVTYSATITWSLQDVP